MRPEKLKLRLRLLGKKGSSPFSLLVWIWGSRDKWTNCCLPADNLDPWQILTSK